MKGEKKNIHLIILPLSLSLTLSLFFISLDDTTKYPILNKFQASLYIYIYIYLIRSSSLLL